MVRGRTRCSANAYRVAVSRVSQRRGRGGGHLAGYPSRGGLMRRVQMLGRQQQLRSKLQLPTSA